MHIRDVKVGKKNLRVSACVLTLFYYKQLSGGSCFMDDYKAKLDSEISLLQFQQKYENVDLMAMSKEQKAEFEKERDAIVKETDFLLNTIVAMIMAGEYPKIRSLENILEDVAKTISNEDNKLLIATMDLTQVYFKPRKIKHNLKPAKTTSDFTTQLQHAIIEHGIRQEELTQPLWAILDIIDYAVEQQLIMQGNEIPKTAKTLNDFKNLARRLNG